MVSPAELTRAVAQRPRIPNSFPWLPLLALTALLVLVFAPVLARMIYEWATLEEMGHGFFVPLVFGYLLWQKRGALLCLERHPSWWGLSFILWGFFQLLLGTAAADYFLVRTAFFISLLGVLWTVVGLSVVRALAFPLFLLLFMIRIPLFIHTQLTLPLQLLASKFAAGVLGFLDVPVMREGNVLQLSVQRLSVAEACSGIRSITSLAFAALVYGYLFDQRRWMPFALLTASIPIAILTNGIRVTIAGLIAEYHPDLAGGAYHTAEGLFIFALALCALFGTRWVISLLDNAVSAWKRGRI